MRSRRAVSLPVEAATTGVVAAPSSRSIPPAVVVVGVGEGREYPPCGDDDLSDPPHPEAASKEATATPMEKSLRI